MAEPLIGYLEYQVLHPVTGAVVVQKLPHLNQDKWDVRFMQPGSSSSASIGTFDVPLIPPGADGHKAAKSDYDKLDYGQRIEGFLGKVGAGTPKFTGVIRKLPKDLGRFAVSGEDSISLLRDQRTHRTEYLSLATDKLFKFALGGWSLVKGDDFSGDLSAYTNNASWALATWPDRADMKCVTNSATGGNKYLYTGSYANANYTDCFIESWYRVTMGTDASIAGEAAILAAMADTSNYVMGRAFVRWVSSTSRWEIDAEIWQLVAGTPTRQARVSIAMTELVNPLRLASLQLIGKRGDMTGPAAWGASAFVPSATGADYLWRLILNGFDGGCTWVQLGVGGSQSGSVGLRWNANSGGSPQVWATQFCFANRARMFQDGAITAGALSITQTFSESASLDIAQQCATTEGFQYRKNPKTGLNADTMDFGAIGTDLTKSVIFRRGENLVMASLEPNAEAPATDMRLQIAPGPDAAELAYRNLGPSGIAKYGWRTEAMQSQNLADTKSGMSLVKEVSDLKAKPGNAKRFTVLRDANTADKWREGDTISVTDPELGLFNQPVVVQGYTFYGGKATMDIIGDQYSLEYNVDYQLRAMRQTIERLAAGVAAVSPSGPSGFVFDNRYGAPFIIPFASGLQPVKAGIPCRIVFWIPANLLALQRVLVSFALLAYRATKQPTSQAGNSGVESGHTHAHSHSIFITNGASAPNLAGLGSGGNISDNTVGAGYDTGQIVNLKSTGSSGHINAIPALTLDNPNDIVESGGATGATVVLDGSTILAGPYTLNQIELDITKYVTGAGYHEVQVTSTALGGIMAQLHVIGLLKAA